MHWAQIVVTQFRRRPAWTTRNTGGTRMAHAIPCPKCGPPHTKCVASYLGGDGHRRWVRVRKYDTCSCLLTPEMDAVIIRIAKAEALFGGPPR